MKKLLTAIFAISITIPAFAREVIGTVVDENNEPMIGASVQLSSDKTVGTTTNTDGYFSLKNVPDTETHLNVRYVGYETQKVSLPTNNIVDIHMSKSSEVLKGVESIGCTPKDGHKQIYNIKTKECTLTECKSARYKLTGQTQATKINNVSCTTDPDYQCDDDNTECKPITIGDACEDQVGHDCTSTDRNAATAKYEWDGQNLNCVITKCKPHFMLDDDKKCVASDGLCDKDQIATIAHATKGVLKNGKCHVTECVPGYEVLNDACVEISGKCKSLPRKAKSGTRAWDNKTSTEICIVTECESGYSISDDKLSCQSKLSEADSRARVDELRENAKKMHDKETSTANKLIGAAGIGATGIGTSQALSALSEQRADNRAENDMRAYLATIKCDYGTGKTVNGGETGIELPGGNELTQYVTQYKTLAADLKVRKTALGMSPGIESETIIDAAETGLYDNAATGKTNGAFTSLSRALSDETSADAQAWAQQKADTASKLKTGAIVAGVGAVGSAIANLAVNSGADKQNKSDEILAKYAAKYTQELQAVIDNVEQQTKTKQCADFTGATGTFPNCQCSGNSYFNTDDGCIACDGGRVVNKDRTGCECPSNLPVEKDGQCTAKTPDCMLSGLKSSEKCECIANATADSNDKCVCNNGYTENDGACIKDQPAPTPSQKAITLNINSDTLFDSGSATVKNADQLKTELQDKMNKLTRQDWDNLTYCVLVTGHTDRTRFRRGSKMNNQKLSDQRAKAVEQIMRQVFTMGTPNFQSSGKGASECTAKEYKKPNDKDCRHVRIVITAGKCNDTNTDTISTLTAVAATVTGATSQTPEKGGKKTDEPTEFKKIDQQTQETPTATPATGADSANTGETTDVTTNDVPNDTNAEKGGKKTNNPNAEVQEKTNVTTETGAGDTTTSGQQTLEGQVSQGTSNVTNETAVDANDPKYQDLVNRINNQKPSDKLTKGFAIFHHPGKPYIPKTLTEDEIQLISDALDICNSSHDGYLDLERNIAPRVTLYEAICYSTVCMGTCGELSSFSEPFKTYKKTIQQKFTDKGYNNTKDYFGGYTQFEDDKEWPRWSIIYREKKR